MQGAQILQQNFEVRCAVAINIALDEEVSALPDKVKFTGLIVEIVFANPLELLIAWRCGVGINMT